MKKVILCILSLTLVGCYYCPDCEWYEKDMFTIINETSTLTAVEIQNWYPLPGPGCSYITINRDYGDICEAFRMDDTVKNYTSVLADVSNGIYDSIIIMKNRRMDNRQNYSEHYLPYRDICIYNFADTTSFILEGAPYHSEWMTCTWTFVDDAIHEIQFVITDSLLSLMEKDYSMLEKFPSRFQ